MDNEFKSLSYRIGSDLLLVQGAGGNTSFKEDLNLMWVKASGTWLSNSLSDDLFVPVDYKKIRQNMMAGLKDPVENTVIGKSLLRPSIETTLHSFLQQKVIIHVHMIDLISLAIRQDGEEVLQHYLNSFEWKWVPYTRPGVDLTNALLTIDKNWSGNVLVLGNHGLVVGGDDCAEAEGILNSIQAVCRQGVRRIERWCHGQAVDAIMEKINIRLPKHEGIHALATDPECFKRCQEGVLYPDQAVFLGPNLKCVGKEDDVVQVVQEHHDKVGVNPDYLIVEGVGVFLDVNAKDILDEMLLCHVSVLLRLDPDLNLRVLSRGEVGALLNWEPEKYRKLLDK